MSPEKDGIIRDLKGFSRTPRSRFAFLLLFLACSLWPLASAVYSQTELGSEDDLTVLGVSATAADPDVEIKGFTVFGATQAAYTGSVVGPGNVVVNGVLAVSSGAYFVGNSTFTNASKIFVNDGSPGQILSKNTGGWLDWIYSSAIGDDLGDHIATTTLNMNGQSIVNAASGTFTQGITASSLTATGVGLVAAQLRFNSAGNLVISSETSTTLGGGVRISTNVYIVGFSSASKYYGDGSSLTGIAGDNLGNHTATKNLDMATFNLVNIGSITANAAITTYSSVTVAGNLAVSTVVASGNITAARYQINGSTVLAVLPGESLGVGINAGRTNTGGYNVFVGSAAGYSHTTGADNSFVGAGAGYYNTTAGGNSFFGSKAGYNTTAGGNSFVGALTGLTNTTGWGNSFMGQGAGAYNDTGQNNSLMGYAAAYRNVAGGGNAILGFQAGYGVSGNSYSSNTLVGSESGFGLMTGSDNILLGWRAGYSVTTGTGNIIVGYNANTSAPAANNELNIGNVIYGNLSAKTVGISTRAPQAALDIVSTGTLSSQYAQIWRDFNGVVKASMTADGKLYATLPNVTGDNLGNHTATKNLDMASFNAVNVSSVNFLSNVFITSAAQAQYGGVYVSTHVYFATGADLNNLDGISGGGALTMSSVTATGIGLSAAQLRLASASGVSISSEASPTLGGGVRISTNVYIVGFSSAAKYYGDGSALTGLTGLADNLGNHTATKNLDMSTFQLSGTGALTMSSVTATGALGVAANKLWLNPNVEISSATGANYGGIYVSSHVYFATGADLYNLDVISGGGALTMSSVTATGIGLSAAQLKFNLSSDNLVISSETSVALGAGLRISTNVYIVGFSSAAKYYGDGSGLTGVVSETALGSKIGGSGTVDWVAKFQGSGNAVTNSSIYDNGTVTVLTNPSSVTVYGKDVSSGYSLVLSSGINMPNGTVNAGLLRFNSSNNIAISSETSAALGGGVRVSTNVYVMGFSSATKYYGDGSALTGLTGLADNLGNHTATKNLDMVSFNMVNVSSVNFLSNVYITSAASAQYGGVYVSSNVYFATGADLYNLDVISGGGALTMSSVTATSALGVAADKLWMNPNVELSSATAANYGGVYSSTHVFVSGNVYAAKLYGDGSGLSGVGDNLGTHIATQTLNMNGNSIVNAASGTFTQGVTASSFTATGVGLVASQLRFNSAGNLVISSETSPTLGGGVRISTNVYIVGFSSASKYYGNGSSLTGISGDNLGNHTATKNLDMASFNMVNVSSVNFLSSVFITSATQAQLGGIYVSSNVYFATGADLYNLDVISGGGALTMSSITAAGIGLSAAQLRLNAANNLVISSEASTTLGGGVRISTNIYIVGFSSAAKYYGDGSALTGLAAGDSLGTHVATQTVNMASWNLVNVSSVNFKSNVFLTSATAAQYGGVYVSSHIYFATGSDIGNVSDVSGAGALTMSSITATGIGLSAAQLRLASAGGISISSEASTTLGAGVRISTNVYIVGFSSAAKYYGDGSALTGITGAADNLGNHTATLALNMSNKAMDNVSSMTITGTGVTGSNPLFKVAGSTMVVLNNGNVGIGTTGPQEKLQVSGGIMVSSGIAAGSWIIGGCTNPGDAGDIMVPVGDLCVDKYEASAWSTPAGGTQYGSASDDYPCNDNGQDCGTAGTKIYARSAVSVTPSRYMTWFQAAAACKNAGKHLLTNAEWQTAAAGTPDPGATGTAPNCNVSGAGPTTTGAGTSCLSSDGVENMIGSLWEWVADWGQYGPNNTSTNGEYSNTAWSAGANYGNDGTWNVGGAAYTNEDGRNASIPALPAAVRRGGNWGTGANAGVFAFHANNAPSAWGDNIGFRCGRRR